MNQLTPRDLRTIGDALNEYAGCLEGAIESCVLPGERWQRNPRLRATVAEDRRALRETDRLLRKIRSLE